MLTKQQAHAYMNALPEWTASIPHDANTASTYITKIEFIQYVEGLEQSIADLALVVARGLKK